MVPAAVSRQGWDRMLHHHLASGLYLWSVTAAPFRYSGEGALPAEDSRMSGAIRAPASFHGMGWWLLGSGNLSVEGQRGRYIRCDLGCISGVPGSLSPAPREI